MMEVLIGHRILDIRYESKVLINHGGPDVRHEKERINRS